VRLRFHGDPKRLYGEALPELNRRLAPFLEDGSLWRVELGTYERETDRYGGAGNIARAEAWFQIESEAVLELIAAYPGDDGAEARWRLCLAGVDRILRTLGYGQEARYAFVQRAREDFAREFGAKNSPLEKQLGDRFRKERKGLDAFLDESAAPDPILAPGLAILDRRDQRLAPLASGILELSQADGLATPLEDLARSLIHMFVNRAQRSAQRMQEFVIYDFLERLYDSRLARLKKGAKAPSRPKMDEPQTDPVG
jgi:thiopeptide-type bacteriocin biosynthesis protein